MAKQMGVVVNKAFEELFRIDAQVTSCLAAAVADEAAERLDAEIMGREWQRETSLEQWFQDMDWENGDRAISPFLPDWAAS